MLDDAGIESKLIFGLKLTDLLIDWKYYNWSLYGLRIAYSIDLFFGNSLTLILCDLGFWF